MQSKRFFVIGWLSFLFVLLMISSSLVGGGDLHGIWNLGRSVHLNAYAPKDVDWSRFAYVQYATL